MSPGTCVLIVTQTGGLVDPVPNPRKLTFSNNVGSAGTYNYKMSNTYFQNGAPFFASVETAFGLNDGTFYSFAIQCQDTVLNTFAAGVNAGVGYAGIETIPPVFITPTIAGCVAIGSQVSFQLIERAFPGSVKLTITPSGNCLNVADNNAARIITFSNSVYEAGTYSFDLNALTNLALQGIVDSVVPTTSFVDSVIYALEYKDAASNPAGTSTSTNVAFSGTETKVPILTLPASGSAIGQAFTVNFTLPERALRGSVKMRFNRISGFADAVGERADNIFNGS